MTELEHQLSELVTVLLRERLSGVDENPKPPSRLSFDFNATPPIVTFETDEAAATPKKACIHDECGDDACEYGDDEEDPMTKAMEATYQAARDFLAFEPKMAGPIVHLHHAWSLRDELSRILEAAEVPPIPRDKFKATADMPEGAPVSSANTRRLRSVSAGQLGKLLSGDRVVPNLPNLAQVEYVVVGFSGGLPRAIPVGVDGEGFTSVTPEHVFDHARWRVVITPENEERFR